LRTVLASCCTVVLKHMHGCPVSKASSQGGINGACCLSLARFWRQRSKGNLRLSEQEVPKALEDLSDLIGQRYCGGCKDGSRRLIICALPRITTDVLEERIAAGHSIQYLPQTATDTITEARQHKQATSKTPNVSLPTNHAIKHAGVQTGQGYMGNTCHTPARISDGLFPEGISPKAFDTLASRMNYSFSD
jgi:hypothetical protein